MLSTRSMQESPVCQAAFSGSKTRFADRRERHSSERHESFSTLLALGPTKQRRKEPLFGGLLSTAKPYAPDRIH